MSSYSKILQDPPKGHHFCQMHRARQSLDDAMFAYVMAGLRKQEAVVVFSSASRLDLIRGHAVASGFGPDALEAQLFLCDGSKILETYVSGNTADWDGFREAVQDTLDAVARKGWQDIRAYGDMVNELWRSERADDTVRLEKLWNEIMRNHTFPLFCGYELDSLDPAAYRNPVRHIGYVHAEVAETEEDPFFIYALDRACTEVIGFPLSATLMHSKVFASRSELSLPLLQQIVLWLERNLPAQTAKVLKRARETLAESGKRPVFRLSAHNPI